MFVSPDFDPVIFSVGHFSLRWYGLMYLIAYAAFQLLGFIRLQQKRDWDISKTQFFGFGLYLILGVIIGGRVGYLLFYEPSILVKDPSRILKIWEGGMSFHGGLLGVGTAMWIYGWQQRISFFKLSDFVAPLIPVGLGLGRIGNFINGELWGKPTSLPWGMVFPMAGDFPRHPSQLYQAFLEGVVLFIIIWLYSTKRRPQGAVTGAFCVCYAVLRMLVELVREPDRHFGYAIGHWVTQGQLLSLPLLAFGLIVLIYAHKHKSP